MLLQVGVQIDGQKAFNSPKSVQAANKRLTVRTVRIVFNSVEQPYSIGWRQVWLGSAPRGHSSRQRLPGPSTLSPELCTWRASCAYRLNVP
jgi:hypothetical protein